MKRMKISTGLKKKHLALRVTTVVAALVLSIVALAGCGNSADPKALYESKCGSCHSLSTVDNAAYKTVEEWQANVDRMKAMTSTISTDDAKKITDYLASR